MNLYDLEGCKPQRQADHGATGIEEIPNLIHGALSLTDHAGHGGGNTIKKGIALHAGEPRTPLPHKEMCNNCDHDITNRAGDEEGVELLSFLFIQAGYRTPLVFHHFSNLRYKPSRRGRTTSQWRLDAQARRSSIPV